MKRIFHYLARYKWVAILAPLFKMLEATFELLVPLVIKNLVAAETERTEKELKEYKEKLQTVYEKYFAAALALVVEKQSCAASLLQRKLKVGYGTAAVLIDLMEALGLVTPHQTTKRAQETGRQVLPAAQEYLDRLPAKE